MSPKAKAADLREYAKRAWSDKHAATAMLLDDAANMIEKLAKRIEELEKQLEEPA